MDGICARVGASLEEADGRGRLDGLRSIGVDETGYEKGRKYMTVVVDHDRGRVVWACAGHGRRQLNAFLDPLTEGQRAGIEVVTAGGARRIADVVAERAPGAELAVDPFHAVSWATGALDEPGRRAWRETGSAPAPRRRRGRPRKGEPAPPDPAGRVRGLRFPLPENPEDLTEGQASTIPPSPASLRPRSSPTWESSIRTWPPGSWTSARSPGCRSTSGSCPSSTAARVPSTPCSPIDSRWEPRAPTTSNASIWGSASRPSFRTGADRVRPSSSINAR
ncbi:ISL3 family transposase [Collinsella stercoris]